MVSVGQLRRRLSSAGADRSLLNDSDRPVRSGDNDDSDRKASSSSLPSFSFSSLSRQVSFGLNTSLRSTPSLPDPQQTQSTIDAAHDAEHARHGGLERDPTKRGGNLSGSESRAEEPVATAVAAVDEDDFGAPSSLPVARIPERTRGVLKNFSRPGLAGRNRKHPARSDKPASFQLSLVSQQYDLDGDGVLNKVEQAMRDRDTNNDGKLDNREVHKIFQDQLKSQHDYGLYRRVAVALTCLVFIQALSNFGTSWVSALLAKDTVAEGESGTINSKRTGEVMGLQGTSHIVDVEELSDEEFEQRRLLVDTEMAEDPDHPDHAHRRLGRNKNKKNACGCSKMAYDHGKIKERDLIELVEKCDGARTVQMRRKWKNGDIMDTATATDYDTICAPGTKVKRKGKKKKNKKKTKTKVVDTHVEFKTKGKDGKVKSITFDCEKGKCYTSGELIHQRAGHPCRIERDFAGTSECEAGLACYDPNDHLARRGAGVCTELREYARRGQICDMYHSVNACEANYACYPTGNGPSAKIRVGTVSTGICRPVVKFASLGEFCGVTLGDDACVNGFRCLGANGREIRRGIGLCRQFEEAAIAVKFGKRNEVCSTDFGLDACEANYACYARNGNFFDAGRGRTGICQAVRSRVGLGGVCSVFYGADACTAGNECLGKNGRSIQAGFGVCANGRGGTNGGSGGCRGSGACLPAGASWAVDCTDTCSCAVGTCMRNCIHGSDRWFCY